MYKISVIELTEIEIIMEVEGNRYKGKKKKKKSQSEKIQPKQLHFFLSKGRHCYPFL